MNSLEQIDIDFTKTLASLSAIIKEFSFKFDAEFTLTDNVDLDPFTKLNYSGLYLFEIKKDTSTQFTAWLEEFKKLWEDQKFKGKAAPSVKNKRVDFHRINSGIEWIPLYIGKSKNVSGRIKEHLKLGLDKPTTALKLMSRDNLYGYDFRVSTIKIDVKNYDLILPQFESSFRDKINPIVGRQ